MNSAFNVRFSTAIGSRSGIRERPGRSCTKKNLLKPQQEFYRVLVKREEKINLGFLITAVIDKNEGYRHEKFLVYVDGGEIDWFEYDEVSNVTDVWPGAGLDAAYLNESIAQNRRHFNYIQMRCLEARRKIKDEQFNFIEPDLSVGQILLFDEKTPVKVIGKTDLGGLNIQIENLVEGWKCWVPFFSINFLQNRELYQKILEERILFKDFKILKSQNCLDLQPKILMPSKIHQSLLGDWNPLCHQLNLVDNIQPLPEENIEIITASEDKRLCDEPIESVPKRIKIPTEDDDGSSGIGSTGSDDESQLMQN